jgi:hypothetical protein
MADRPDYSKLLEDDEDARAGPAPEQLPRTRGVLEKPPQSFFAAPDVPAVRMPVPTPDLRLLGMQGPRNPRLGADVNTPMMGGTLGLGLQASPLAPRGQVDPSFSLRYKRQF